MNWQKLITELIESGMTQQEVADAAKCSQAFISDLKAGKRTGCEYSIGAKLVELSVKAKKHTKKQAA